MVQREPTADPFHSRRSATRSLVHGRRSPLLLAVMLSALAMLAVGCGAGSTTTTTAPPTSTPASAPATTSSTPATTPAGAGLSGTWNGQYSGGYQGTFKLVWLQSGSSLTGSIKLSSPASTLPIHGTVRGSAISFGTVGAYGITYTGSVSGSSMSGSYQTVQGGGSWSASKS